MVCISLKPNNNFLKVTCKFVYLYTNVLKSDIYVDFINTCAYNNIISRCVDMEVKL